MKLVPLLALSYTCESRKDIYLHMLFSPFTVRMPVTLDVSYLFQSYSVPRLPSRHNNN